MCRDSQVDIINNIHNPLEAEALFLSEKALCMPVNNGKRLKGTGSRRVLLLEIKIWSKENSREELKKKNRNSKQPAQYEHTPERYPKRYRSFLERNTVSDIALAPCSSLHCFPADTWWSVVKRRNVSKSIQSFLLSIISFW